MKKIYMQRDSSSLLKNTGIQNCYFKHLSYGMDKSITSKKEHHHTGYEIHFVKKGHQIYKIGGNHIKICANSFMVIPPLTKHRVTENFPQTEKYSLTFNTHPESVFCNLGYMFDKTDTNIKDIICSIGEESHFKKAMWHEISEVKIYEILVYILRKHGFVQKETINDVSSEDARLSMAKQYIKDNTQSNLKVSEVADYCYISSKQLTRLFEKENTSPAKYIRDCRIAQIESLLGDRNLSLKNISEIMNFSSEYQFNSFFRKYSGMPPGEYRKMNL